jgi:hypothetical protein
MPIRRVWLLRAAASCFLGAVVLSTALYARDETLVPCGMLRSEMKRAVLDAAARERFEYRAAVADDETVVSSAAWNYNMIDAATSRYGQMTCAKLLVRLNALRPNSYGLAPPL